MDLHWRNTQKPARLWVLDARAAIGLFIFMLHANRWTFGFAILTMLVFWVLERRGLTFEAALRAGRSWFLGSKRPALRPGSRRRWIDFG